MAYTSYQANTRLLVNSAKDRPCMDCGVQYPSFVMQFDHVRGVKLFNISSGWRSQSYSAVVEEIAKCEVVCANCHAIRTFRRSVLRNSEKEDPKNSISEKVEKRLPRKRDFRKKAFPEKTP